MTNLIHVAVAVIRNPAGQVFITLRPEHVHQGGLWEFPGGKVEKGESVFEALRREIHEENAIDIQRARPLIKIPFRYPDKQVLLDVWEVLEFSGTAHGREGQACRWVNAGELSQIAFPAANKAIITAVQLPAVYLITPEPGANTQDFLQQLESRLASGITLLQLRAKHLESDHYIHLANEVVELCHRYHASVLLNHDPAVLAKVPADGIHLTARRLMQLEGRPIAESLWLAASCSTKHASAAPRDNASKPSTPVPAKRSRQRAPTTASCNQLNSVSRTRSGVGRTAVQSGISMRRPRHSPATIRMRPCTRATLRLTM